MRKADGQLPAQFPPVRNAPQFRSLRPPVSSHGTGHHSLVAGSLYHFTIGQSGPRRNVAGTLSLIPRPSLSLASQREALPVGKAAALDDRAQRPSYKPVGRIKIDGLFLRELAGVHCRRARGIKIAH